MDTNGHRLHRSYHSANCDKYHSFLCCKVKLQSKYFYRIKQAGKPRIDTSKMSKPDLVQQFNNTLKKKIGSTLTENSAFRKWCDLRNTIYSTGLDKFGN